MQKTTNLNLPIYNDPANDKFHLDDWNTANTNLEAAYNEMKSDYNEAKTVNVNLEVANTHTGADGRTYNYLGDRLDRVDSDLAEITKYPILTGEVNVINKSYPYGNIIRYGAISDYVSNTNYTNNITAIWNAFTSIVAIGYGKVTVPKGDFGINNTVTIKYQKSLVFEEGARLYQTADVDFIVFENESKLVGNFYELIVDIDSYTHNALCFYGYKNIDKNTLAKGFTLTKVGSVTGTGIHFLSNNTNNNAEHIQFVKVHDFRINNFNTMIYLESNLNPTLVDTTTWVTSTLYTTGQYVFYNGDHYKCISNITSAYTPDNSAVSSYWTKVTTTWVTGTSYTTGQFVLYNGDYYKCIGNVTSAYSPDNSNVSAYWTKWYCWTNGNILSNFVLYGGVTQLKLSGYYWGRGEVAGNYITNFETQTSFDTTSCISLVGGRENIIDGYFWDYVPSTAFVTNYWAKFNNITSNINKIKFSDYNNQNTYSCKTNNDFQMWGNSNVSLIPQGDEGINMAGHQDNKLAYAPYYRSVTAYLTNDGTTQSAYSSYLQNNDIGVLSNLNDLFSPDNSQSFWIANTPNPFVIEIDFTVNNSKQKDVNLYDCSLIGVLFKYSRNNIKVRIDGMLSTDSTYTNIYNPDTLGTLEGYTYAKASTSKTESIALNPSKSFKKLKFTFYQGTTLNYSTGITGTMRIANIFAKSNTYAGGTWLRKDGDLMVSDLDFTLNTGVVLKSPDGSRWRLKIDNTGAINGLKL